MATNTTDRAFKILTNRRVTDETKAYYEEVGDETLIVTADQLWAETVPDNDPGTGISNSIVEFQSQLVLTEDVTVADQESWYAADGDGYRLKDWVSDRFGSDYTARLYDNAGSQIFPTDTLDWFFDYPTGIVTISGDASAFAQPFKLDGYRYIGTKGLEPSAVYSYQTVADITARNAIPTAQRTEGMLVYVVADAASYRLGAGLTNSDWVVESAGGGSGAGVTLVPNQAARDAAAFDGYQVYQQDIDALWLYEDGEWQMQSIQSQYDPYEDGYGLYFWMDASSGDDNNDGLDVTRPRQNLSSIIKDLNRVSVFNGFVKVMFAAGSYDIGISPELDCWCLGGLFFQARPSTFVGNEYITIPGGTGALGDGYVTVWDVTTSAFASFSDHEKSLWIPDSSSPSGDIILSGDSTLLESNSPTLRSIRTTAPTWTDGYIVDFEVRFTGGAMFPSHGSIIQAKMIEIDLEWTIGLLSQSAFMQGWHLANCKVTGKPGLATTIYMGNSTSGQGRFLTIDGFGTVRSRILPGLSNCTVAADIGEIITIPIESSSSTGITDIFIVSGCYLERVNFENGKLSFGGNYCFGNTYIEMNHVAGAHGSSLNLSGAIDINGLTSSPFIEMEHLVVGRSLSDINLISCGTLVLSNGGSQFRFQSGSVIGNTTQPVLIVADGGRITGAERVTATNTGTPGQDIQVGGNRGVTPGYLSNAEMASNKIASSDDGSIIQYNDDAI